MYVRLKLRAILNTDKDSQDCLAAVEKYFPWLFIDSPIKLAIVDFLGIIGLSLPNKLGIIALSLPIKRFTVYLCGTYHYV